MLCLAASISRDGQKRTPRRCEEQFAEPVGLQCSLTRGKKSPASGNTAQRHRPHTLEPREGHDHGPPPSQNQVVGETGVEHEVKNVEATNRNDGVEEARCTSDAFVATSSSVQCCTRQCCSLCASEATQEKCKREPKNPYSERSDLLLRGACVPKEAGVAFRWTSNISTRLGSSTPLTVAQRGGGRNVFVPMGFKACSVSPHPQPGFKMKP